MASPPPWPFVQPVEVAVEHDRGWAAGFAVSPLEQGLQGGGIAVQATDDIDGVGL
jgi:hypothetical protein